MKLTFLTKDSEQEISFGSSLCMEDLGLISLECGGVRSLDLQSGQSCYLVAYTGIGWVTMEGDTTDHALTTSTTLQFMGPGRLVIEAVDEEGLHYEAVMRAGQDS